jgi:hypothetical protein
MFIAAFQNYLEREISSAQVKVNIAYNIGTSK